MAADMAWMGRTLEKRGDPRLVLEGAQTMVMLGVNYAGEREVAGREDQRSNTKRAAWARPADIHAQDRDRQVRGICCFG